MKTRDTPPSEDFTIRCPRLGHQIFFSYCRSENRGLPCFKALECWYDHFQVREFLKQELTAGEWEAAFSRPPQKKILSLVELIEQAGRNKEKS